MFKYDINFLFRQDSAGFFRFGAEVFSQHPGDFFSGDAEVFCDIVEFIFFNRHNTLPF